MPLTAIAFSIPLAATTELPLATTPRNSEVCDFSGDGRLCMAGVESPSAWACSGFYLAILACAVLWIAVMIVRMGGMIRHVPR